MAIIMRSVKNGKDRAGHLTGQPGVVYDVRVKYKYQEQWKTHVRRGFPSQDAALRYEKQARLSYCGGTGKCQEHQGIPLYTYLMRWLDNSQGRLRANSYNSYFGLIKNHIEPAIGGIIINDLNSSILDTFYGGLAQNGMASTSIQTIHRILSSSLEQARKQGFLVSNPCKDISFRFGQSDHVPTVYTIGQVAALLTKAIGEWRLIFVLASLFGLRISEILGLHWSDINSEERIISIQGQLPCDANKFSSMEIRQAPLKSKGRVLRIPYCTWHFFEEERDRKQTQMAEQMCYDSGFVVCHANGHPKTRQSVFMAYQRMLSQWELPKGTFHDLRHTAATNMCNLGGDLPSISYILGHSIKRTSAMLGSDEPLSTITAEYIHPNCDSTLKILTAYHEAVLREYDR